MRESWNLLYCKHSLASEGHNDGSVIVVTLLNGAVLQQMGGVFREDTSEPRRDLSQGMAPGGSWGLESQGVV